MRHMVIGPVNSFSSDELLGLDLRRLIAMTYLLLDAKALKLKISSTYNNANCRKFLIVRRSFYWYIFGRIVEILWSGTPAHDLVNKVLDSACPLDQLCFFPSAVLQRKGNRHSGFVQTYGNTYDRITW